LIRVNKIVLDNYKNIQHSEVNLEAFNVIVGPNNSGKSNFLTVIPFLNYLINGAADSMQDSLHMGVHTSDFGFITPLKQGHYNDTMRISIQFSNSKINKCYEYNLVLAPLDGKHNKQHPSSFFIESEEFSYKDIGRRGPHSYIFRRKDNAVQFGERLKAKNKVENVANHSSVVTLLNIILEKDLSTDSYYNAIQTFNEILNSKIFYFSHTELSKYKTNRIEIHNGRTISIDLNEEISSLQKTNKWELFKSAIKEIIKIRSVETIERNNPQEMDEEVIILFDHLGTTKSINQLSDGSLLLLAFITKILTSKNDIFLLEEPENSTHPQALLGLVSFIRSFEDEKQFIITSHSVPLINVLSPENVIVAGVNIEGVTSFKRVQDQKEILKELRKGYVSFSDKIFFDDEY